MKKVFYWLFFSPLLLFFSCNGGSEPSVPSPVAGSFSTGVSAYICGTGSPAVFVINTNDVALLSVDITGDEAPQFKHMKVHQWFDNLIDCGSNPNCCVSAAFPSTGSYRVTLFFNEKGSSSCLPPGPNQCFRWMFTQTFASGFTPSCSNNEVFITTPNPNGFQGPCS